jgi:integrase
MTRHVLLDGRLHLYRRKGSPYWQCATYLGAKNWRVSTKEAELPQAKDVAEDWYWTLRERFAAGKIKSLRRFRDVAAAFVHEYETLLRYERSAQYIKSHGDTIRLYLNPFFGDKPIDAVTSATVMEFRVWRCRLAIEKYGKPAARQTLKKDIVTLRMILKLAERNGWIDRVPDCSEPFPKRELPSHRAWFSAEEYAQLCRATWACVQRPPSHTRDELCRQLHDYVVFMANTGLRPDEASRLEFRDVVIDEEEWEEPILVLDVRGKRGVGICKSMPGAVRAYRRLLERHKTANGGKIILTDQLFPLDHRSLFNRILVEQDLKVDREGRPRSAYSLRHTYICLRLLHGANIFHLAMNCRTSVEMIEKYYARHISTQIDTTRLNLEREARTPAEPESMGTVE